MMMVTFSAWTVSGYLSLDDAPVVSVTSPEPQNINTLFPLMSKKKDYHWRYETTFHLASTANQTLEFLGLSPLCTIFLNGQVTSKFDNAFFPQIVQEEALVVGENTLRIEFAPLTAFLNQRHPRAKWKTNLAHNNLRWLRTSLLGHITGWTPSEPEIGVTKPVTIYNSAHLKESDILVQPSVKNNVAAIFVSSNNPNVHIHSVTVELSDKQSISLQAGEQNQFEAVLKGLDLWWPHTHGKPTCHTLTFIVTTNNGSLTFTKTLGFKAVTLTNADSSPCFSINDQDLFLRGACWTSSDINQFQFDKKKTERILKHSVDIGMNCIRIGGTMNYEANEFYELCDKLGLLVWQDFMFANFDYPTELPFLESVTTEVEFQTKRLSQFTCLLVFCGNSEVAQQAAMVGKTQADWQHPIFNDIMPNSVNSLASFIPYLPSSPYSGAMPFDTDEGFSHYFGLGAYLRDEADLEAANVQFTSECLGHSHCPDEQACKLEFSSPNPPTVLPVWKQGIPRDAHVGWDFEDVREHYLSQYFNCSPSLLRYNDLERYHLCSRIITGHLVAQAMGYWRSTKSSCSGAILWWLNDLYPGAGWGLITDKAELKPAAYIVKPALQRVSIRLLPNGLNGHLVSMINETRELIIGNLTLKAINTKRNSVVEHSSEIVLKPNSNRTLKANSLFNRFLDTDNSYRFGSEPIDAVCVNFQTEGLCLTHTQFPTGLSVHELTSPNELAIEVKCTVIGDQKFLVIKSNKLIAFAKITTKLIALYDNYQTLIPDTPVLFLADWPSEIDADTLTVSAYNMAFSKRLSVDINR